MKKMAILLGACSCLTLTTSAMAADEAESFKVSAWFGISKCMKKPSTGGGQPTTDCQVVTPEQPTQANVSLESCENLPNNGGTSCSGQWTDTRSIEGHTYVGAIRVTKSTDASGKASYMILSRTEQKDIAESITLHILSLAKSTVTDSSISFGKTVTQKDATGNEVVYVPILAVTSESGMRDFNPRQLLGRGK